MAGSGECDSKPLGSKNSENLLDSQGALCYLELISSFLFICSNILHKTDTVKRGELLKV